MINSWYNEFIVSCLKYRFINSSHRKVVFMIHNLTKRYILDISTGICHDLNHIHKSCHIENLKSHHIFNADSLNGEIKRHPAYKSKCKHCMSQHDYD